MVEKCWETTDRISSNLLFFYDQITCNNILFFQDSNEETKGICERISQISKDDKKTEFFKTENC